MGSCLMKEVYPNHLSGYEHVKMHQEKPRERCVSVRRQSGDTVEDVTHPRNKQNSEWTEVWRLWKSYSFSGNISCRYTAYVVISLRFPPDWGRAASHKFPFICHRVEEVISVRFSFSIQTFWWHCSTFTDFPAPTKRHSKNPNVSKPRQQIPDCFKITSHKHIFSI